MKNHIFLLLFLGLISCEQMQETQTLTDSISASGYLEEVNKIRKEGCKCGNKYFAPTGTLIWNKVLETTALQHSKDMHSKNKLSHMGSDGSTPDQRLIRNGYLFKYFGENVQTMTGIEPTEAMVINNWKLSPSHCENLMNPNFKEMAVAQYNNYWTQILAAK